MPKRTNVSIPDGKDTKDTPIKEPKQKKQKKVVVEKMEDIHKLPVKKNSSSSGDGDDETSTNSTSSPSGDSLSLPSPSPKPSKIVLAQLLNLQRELGIVNQTRIEILWNLEDS